MSPEEHGYQHAINVAKAARTAFGRLMEPIQSAARAKGYAVAVHGSIARDVDLLAVPWTEEAVPAEELVAAVVAAIAHIQEANNGLAHLPPDQQATPKPHGRRAWVIVLGGGTWLDLSVMPLGGVR